MKQRLRSQLVKGRQYTESLLSAFQTPEQWTHQVHDRANHALWFAGHMAVSDNFFVALIDQQRAAKLPEWDARFGAGSHPTSNPADYPPVDEVLELMRERRKVLLGLLDELDEAGLARSTPEGAPDFLPDVGSVFETAVWHEGIHSGQVTVVHRALGNPPIFPGEPSS